MISAKRKRAACQPERGGDMASALKKLLCIIRQLLYSGKIERTTKIFFACYVASCDLALCGSLFFAAVKLFFPGIP